MSEVESVWHKRKVQVAVRFLAETKPSRLALLSNKYWQC
ncbi:hypothetical protein AD16_3499 [Escherichia coli 3-267-03_S4_C2]|nr:hypothetical protein AD16_3499 [Escherichia coli 3-267-03_S4_C2]KEL84793.1 hypothetical protein AC22_2485 [Escherichia coli 5-366-08_S3_C2]